MGGLESLLRETDWIKVNQCQRQKLRKKKEGKSVLLWVKSSMDLRLHDLSIPFVYFGREFYSSAVSIDALQSKVHSASSLSVQFI